MVSAAIVDTLREVLPKMNRPHAVCWLQGAIERKLGYKPLKTNVREALEYLFKRREAMYTRFQGWHDMPYGLERYWKMVDNR